MYQYNYIVKHYVSSMILCDIILVSSQIFNEIVFIAHLSLLVKEYNDVRSDNSYKLFLFLISG